MNINETGPFLISLADPSVKSKHFSIDSLVNIAFLKKKLNDAAQDYSDTIQTLDVKVKKSEDGRSYIPLDDSEESLKDYKEFVKKNSDLRRQEIEGIKLNFVPKDELKKVLEDTSLDLATGLIYHLVKE